MLTLNDLKLFLGEEMSPEILRLKRPLVLLELISPKAIFTDSDSDLNFDVQTQGKSQLKKLPQKNGIGSINPLGSIIPICDLLQGPVQRLDLIFRTGENHLINGKVYLSSDFSPAMSSTALFWSPDISLLLERNSNDNNNNNTINNNKNNDNSIDNNTINNKNYNGINYDNNNDNKNQLLSDVLDSIQYHPLLLNSSCQPAQPLLLPNIPPNTVYCVPLFLRSETQGVYKLRLLTEFFPKINQTSVLTLF